MCLHIFFDLYLFTVCLTVFQCGSEFSRVYLFLEAQKHFRPRLAVEDIISFILRNVLAKVIAYVLQGRMALNGKVTAFPGIQEIESYWKLFSKEITMPAG